MLVCIFPGVCVCVCVCVSVSLCLHKRLGLYAFVLAFRAYGNRCQRQGLGKDEHDVCAERVGVWGGKDVAQAPAGQKHNKHFGKEEVSVQRVGVWHNSWAHYPTVVTPNDRRHKYAHGERYNHGIH